MVLWEDRDSFAIAKPAGFICEGPQGTYPNPSLETLLRDQGRSAYAAHRLDVDTTGVLLFVRQKKAIARYQELFSSKRVRKSYLAVVHGAWPKSINKVEASLRRRVDQPGYEAHRDGQSAITTFRLLASASDRSLVEALPKTGRTHQIRLHCLETGHPILGDKLYSKANAESSEGTPPMALHAQKLRFCHPVSGEDINISCPLPDYWQDYWLRGLSWPQRSKNCKP